MQEALSMAQETAMQGADILGEDRVRGGSALGTFRMPGLGLYECSDGYVYLMAAGLAGSGFPGFLELMDESGEAGDLTEEPYATFVNESMNRGLLAAMGQDPDTMQELMKTLDHIDEIVQAFVRAHPKQYIYERSQEHRVLAGMVSTAQDISASPQLAARDWWNEIEDRGRGKTLRYPGPPWQLEGTPATLRRPAPLLGEHNEELFVELGLAPGEIAALARAGVV